MHIGALLTENASFRAEISKLTEEKLAMLQEIEKKNDEIKRLRGAVPHVEEISSRKDLRTLHDRYDDSIPSSDGKKSKLD